MPTRPGFLGFGQEARAEEAFPLAQLAHLLHQVSKQRRGHSLLRASARHHVIVYRECSSQQAWPKNA